MGGSRGEDRARGRESGRNQEQNDFVTSTGIIGVLN